MRSRHCMLKPVRKEKAERLNLEGWVRRLEKSDPESRDLAHLLEDLAALQALRGDFTTAEASYLSRPGSHCETHRRAGQRGAGPPF